MRFPELGRMHWAFMIGRGSNVRYLLASTLYSKVRSSNTHTHAHTHLNPVLVLSVLGDVTHPLDCVVVALLDNLQKANL